MVKADIPCPRCVGQPDMDCSLCWCRRYVPEPIAAAYAVLTLGSPPYTFPDLKVYRKARDVCFNKYGRPCDWTMPNLPYQARGKHD